MRDDVRIEQLKKSLRLFQETKDPEHWEDVLLIVNWEELDQEEAYA